MWILECAKMMVLPLATGAVAFLMMGSLGTITAAMLSARITHHQERDELEKKFRR